MAYNANNEERKELAKVQKNSRGEYIVAAEITNKNTGNVSIDIRQFYTDDNDELKPTSKGVRFSAEMLGEVVAGLVQALDFGELITANDTISEMIEKQESDDDEPVDDMEDED